jgi:hypothetical protein
MVRGAVGSSSGCQCGAFPASKGTTYAHYPHEYYMFDVCELRRRGKGVRGAAELEQSRCRCRGLGARRRKVPRARVDLRCLKRCQQGLQALREAVGNVESTPRQRGSQKLAGRVRHDEDVTCARSPLAFALPTLRTSTSPQTHILSMEKAVEKSVENTIQKVEQGDADSVSLAHLCRAWR